MPGTMNLRNRTAVVTGAAGGIGRGIAKSLACRGCHLALADVNEAELARTAAMVAAPGLRVSQHRLDVADRAAVAALPAQVLAQHSGVDILVNNAGVAIGGTFDQVSEADFEWLFEINFWGVVRMTRAFMSALRASDDARIVNISSVYGIISPPGQTAYSASKFAVRGFSNALRHELASSKIGVTVVHPGGIATSIAKNARVPKGVSEEEMARHLQTAAKLMTLPPDTAGEIIVLGMEHRKARVLVGSDAKMIALIERFFPISYLKHIERLKPRE